MNIHFKNLLAGRYRLKKYDAATGECTGDTDWFDNLIVDQGLDQIGSVSNYNTGYPYPLLFNTCNVGTGSATPSTTDTQMDAFLAAVVSNDTFVTSYVAAAGGNPAYWKCVHTYRFPAGTATGNLTEVGTGNNKVVNIGDALFSRALILDGGGSPTTLTVLSTETLDVTYEFRVYLDVTGIAFSQVINGTTYTGTWNAYDISSPGAIYSGYDNGGTNLIVGIASNVDGGGSSYAVNPVSSGYLVGSYQRSYTGTIPTGQGNYTGGLKFIKIQTLHNSISIETSPYIVKNNTQTFSVTFTVSWARYP